MENLLCDEVMSPFPDKVDGYNAFLRMHSSNSFCLPIQDCDEAFAIFLGNESSFMPKSGYLKLLQTDSLIRTARFKAVNYFIKFQRRMNLSVEIVFIAVNYLDRFISLDQCRGLNCGMFELLSVACLSVALKFSGTACNFLNEFQMNGDLENSFDTTKIQEMELTLMTALGWRMNSTTPFAYIHIIIQKIYSQEIVVEEDFSERVTELLVNALLDPKFLEFKQCVIALCSIRCVIDEENMNTDSLHTIIPQEHKDDVIKCMIMMEQLWRSCWGGGPSSPVTVLKEEEKEFTKSSRKRKMEERVECMLM